MGESLFDILGLKEVEWGEVQSVEEMSLVPILGKDRSNRIATPNEVKFKRTTNYGSMSFQNENPDFGAIILSNLMIISNLAAQDHAMAGVGLLDPGKTKTFTDACCIQSSQGGLLSESENYYDILPLELRAALLNPQLRRRKEYGKLWPSITQFLQNVPGVVSAGAHLEFFFRPYQKDLEDFTSEFEPIDGQIGALILYNGIPAGIEILPTAEHWGAYWKWIIRGCYGAQLLKMKLTKQIEPLKLGAPSLPKEIGQVEERVDDYLETLKSTMVTMFTALSVSGSSPTSTISDLISTLVSVETGGGDIVQQGPQTIYASLVVYR